MKLVCGSDAHVATWGFNRDVGVAPTIRLSIFMVIAVSRLDGVIYTRVLNKGGKGRTSPLDNLL